MDAACLGSFVASLAMNANIGQSVTNSQILMGFILGWWGARSNLKIKTLLNKMQKQKMLSVPRIGGRPMRRMLLGARPIHPPLAAGPHLQSTRPGHAHGKRTWDASKEGWIHPTWRSSRYSSLHTNLKRVISSSYL